MAIVLPSLISTTVNSINNHSFTPTLGFSAFGINASVGYNTGNGSTTVSAGFGYAGFGVNASVTADKYGCFAGGSIGLSYGNSTGSIGLSVNFGYNGQYMGVSLNAGLNFGGGNGYSSYGVGLNGSFTLNADGTTSCSGGASISGGFAGATGSLGITLNNDGTTAMTGSGGYDDKQAEAWRDELSKEAAKNDTALAPIAEVTEVNKEVVEETKALEPLETQSEEGVASPVSLSDANGVTSEYGYRTDPTGATKNKEFHPGIDISAPGGSKARSAYNGIVENIGWQEKGAGRYVVIKNDNGRYSYYMHLQKDSSSILTVGQRVGAGDQIGNVGSTGRSTGNHLHYEERNSIDQDRVNRPSPVRVRNLYD
jgi:hypothetical protein